MTIKYCQQRIPSLRKCTRWSVASALHAIGFSWLRRRRKRWVRPELLAPRMAFSRWILRQPTPVLSLWELGLGEVVVFR